MVGTRPDIVILWVLFLDICKTHVNYIGDFLRSCWSMWKQQIGYSDADYAGSVEDKTSG